MSNEKLINRRDRRGFMKSQGALRIKSNLKYKDWRSLVRTNIEEGYRLHLKNEDTWRNLVYDKLTLKESAIVKNLKECNYSQKDIDLYLENWYKTI